MVNYAVYYSNGGWSQAYQMETPGAANFKTDAQMRALAQENPLYHNWTGYKSFEYDPVANGLISKSNNIDGCDASDSVGSTWAANSSGKWYVLNSQKVQARLNPSTENTLYKIKLAPHFSGDWIGEISITYYIYVVSQSAPTPVVIHIRGSGTVSGAGTYHVGDTVTLTAYPGSGYYLDSWSWGVNNQGISYGDNANPISFTIRPEWAGETVDVYVDFCSNSVRYQVTFVAGAHGSVSPTSVSVPAGAYPYTYPEKLEIYDTYWNSNLVATINAYPDSGYIASWNPTNMRIYENTTIYVTFIGTGPYTVTINAGSNGNVRNGTTSTPTTQIVLQNVPAGTSISTSDNKLYVNGKTIYAIADQGYVFQDWSYPSPVVTDNITISANFRAVVTYVVVADDGHGSASGGGTYYLGDQVTLTATPNTGYDFDRWTSGGGYVSTENPLTFNVTQAMIGQSATYTAHFKQIYTLSCGVNNPSWGSLSYAPIPSWVDNTYVWSIGSDNKLTIRNTGTSATYVVTPVPATSTAEYTYAFTGWSTPSGTVSPGTSTAATAFSANSTFTANFTRSITTYTMSASVDYSSRGTVYIQNVTQGTQSASGSSASLVVNYDDIIWFHATANTGYSFYSWWDELHGEDAGSDNPFEIEATENLGMSAQFTANSYTVTFDAGSGSVSPSSKSVTFGSTYGELPTPTWAEHTFAGWYTSGGDRITSSSTVDTPSNHTLYAHWDLTTYTIYAESEDSTKGLVRITSGSQSSGSYASTATLQVDSGSDVTFHATAQSGYMFKNWMSISAQPIPISSNPEYTVSNVTSDLSLAATFETLKFRLIFDDNGGQDGPGTLEYVDPFIMISHRFEIPSTEPYRSGYDFKGWCVSGTSTPIYRYGTVNDHYTVYVNNPSVTMVAQWEERVIIITLYTGNDYSNVVFPELNKVELAPSYTHGEVTQTFGQGHVTLSNLEN